MSSAVLSICIGLTELAVGNFHQNPLDGASEETKCVDYSAVTRGREFRGGFAEGEDCTFLLTPAGVKLVRKGADLRENGLDVRGGNLLLRRVEVSDDAGLAVRDVLVHGRIIVGDDAFAAGDLLEEGHADALLGARGDVHAETVEERGVFFGGQEVALDDKLVQRVGFKQRTDR